MDAFFFLCRPQTPFQHHCKRRHCTTRHAFSPFVSHPAELCSLATTHTHRWPLQRKIRTICSRMRIRRLPRLSAPSVAWLQRMEAMMRRNARARSDTHSPQRVQVLPHALRSIERLLCVAMSAVSIVVEEAQRRERDEKAQPDLECGGTRPVSALPEAHGG